MIGFNKNNAQLEKHLCFSIYELSRAIQRMYKPFLNELNLTYPQYLVLVALYDHDNITVSELGELLDLNYGTLSPLLTRMESQKLIERTRSTNDTRIVYIKLMSSGKEVREEAFTLPQQLVFKSGLNDQEWNELSRLSMKVFNNLSK
ncbi:MarR family winged helix-turn-helix transcriptional regulator [Leuconostoc mesenteroides]|uniref:MarR family winged helix-turn-helix transcriptional regulator n=1 Tax=Leuconostoc mesenteroides TaxID=1245 RepID=UPI0021A7A903|nr:MarR family transcriptional regulator [Leuconostoc mesenteroides]MCT3046574.1 MarR family transcriptional regulator [Leuconostoc mesenteroides]